MTQVRRALTIAMLLMSVSAACSDHPVLPTAMSEAPSAPSLTTTPLNAYISGPTNVLGGAGYTWTANPSGGDGAYTYEWHYKVAGTPTWMLVGTAASYTRRVGGLAPTFDLRLTVTSAGVSVIRGIQVTVQPVE